MTQCQPGQQRPNFKNFAVLPDYITSPLMKDGVDCLTPDAGTQGIHYSAWVAKPMSQGPEAVAPLGLSPYFLSARQNFNELYAGPKCSKDLSRFPPFPLSREWCPGALP